MITRIRCALLCALLACSCAAQAPKATPKPSPTPLVVASPGTGGQCSNPVPAGFTCVTGTVQTPSFAPVAGVCVNVGLVANCPFASDLKGNWRVELVNGVRFILSFTVGGQEKAKIDLTPSYLDGGTKAWPTQVVIE